MVAIAAKDKSFGTVSFDTTFTAKDKTVTKISEEFDHNFEYEFADAHKTKELVFYYKPDRTLIVADLFFNLPATEAYSRSGIDPASGVATILFAAIQNTRGTAIW
jgi:hypothetical protein